MAFKSKSVCAVFMLLLCLVVVLQQSSSDCVTGHGCFYAQIKRKILYGIEGKERVLNGPTSSGPNEKNMVGWELRDAPLGPDPLHHHGGSPKKPRTP